jgi:hypothetical protein
MQTITESQAASLIADKKDFWQFCERNGYHMPDLHCPITTLEFLRDTKEGKVFVPKYVSLIVRPCPEPPT